MASRPVSQSNESENLDDLDDILDEFTQPAPSTSQSAAAPKPPKEDDLDAAFMAELTKNMSSMFQQGAPASTSAKTSMGMNAKEESEFKAFFEEMMRSSAQGSDVTEDELQDTLREMEMRLKAVNQTAAASPGASTAKGGSFQDSVKQTYDKIKASDASARAEMDAASSSANQDPLAAMLAQLESSMGADDPSIQETLEAMMGQLMSKELLYEPIKDLNSKYPTFLEESHPDISEEDMDRYKRQSQLVAQIAAQFEESDYDDENPQHKAKIIELMQEMQNCGSPPPSMMGDLPPGMSLGPDGLPNLGADCPQS